MVDLIDEPQATAGRARRKAAHRRSGRPLWDRDEPLSVQLLRLPAAPVAALVALMGVYIAVFGSLTWSQQSNYGTFGFDMGIYDQGIWLLSRFKDPFLTIRGLNYFGHHVNVITLLIVPLYWLGAGPHALYLIETIALALGAVPLWLLGRDRFDNAWLALGPVVAYLLYPSLEWINEWHFHPDALIITPLMFSYWLATRRRWGWYWVALAVTLACKEDAALAVLALGFVLWFRERQRRQGIATSAAGLAWFLVCTRLIIPFANGGGSPFYTELFPGLGTSMTSIAYNLIRHPSRWLKPVLSRSRWTYYAQLLWPVALVALLEVPVLLIAFPQLVVNTVSGDPYTHDIHFHYSSILVAAVFLATVEACAHRGRTESGRRFLVGLVVAASFAANVAWSPSHLGVKYHSGIWAKAQPKDKALNAALRLVPRSASVSATYYIDPHLTHRVLIYEFPNPWIPSNWGFGDKDPPDPSKVDWLVLDTTLNGSMQPLYDKLVHSEFQVVFDTDNIVVAHRVVAGVPNDHDWPR
jgi:uncharacterized membrane protein